MPKPKLVYFNARGRAELIRLVFAAAKVDFEDVRVEREQWPEWKKKTPTGVVPWVEADEGSMVQSGAIARYFARKYNLFGSSDWEYFLVERALAQMDEIFNEALKIFFAPAEKKAEVTKEFQENKGKNLLGGLSNFLKDGGNSGLFVPSGLTIADLMCMNLMDILAPTMSEFMEKFPTLAAVAEKVKQVSPSVADWLKKRPVTQM